MKSNVSELIEEYKRSDEEFTKELTEAQLQLDIAVALNELRNELGLTKEAFAKKVNKPLTTISQIENATLKPNLNVLHEIATAVGKKIQIEFI